MTIKKTIQFAAIALMAMFIVGCSGGKKVKNATIQEPLNEYIEFTKDYSEVEVHFSDKEICIDQKKGHYHAYFDWVHVKVPVKKIKEFPPMQMVDIYATVETPEGNIELLTFNDNQGFEYVPDFVTDEMLAEYEEFVKAPVGSTAVLTFVIVRKPGYFDYSQEKAKENRNNSYKQVKAELENTVKALTKGNLTLYSNGLAFYLDFTAMQEQEEAAIQALKQEIGTNIKGTWFTEPNENIKMWMTFGNNGEYEFLQETYDENDTPVYTITLNGTYDVADSGAIETNVPAENIMIDFVEGYFPNNEIMEQARNDMKASMLNNGESINYSMALDQSGNQNVLHAQGADYTKVEN